MTEISRLQTVQNLNPQLPSEQIVQQAKVSFKGKDDSFEKSSSKDVAVVATAGAAAGAYGVGDFLKKAMGNLIIENNFDGEEKETALKELSESFKEDKKLFKTSKENLKNTKKELKEAEKALKNAADDAKPVLEATVNNAKEAFEEAAKILKDSTYKVPVKYRAIAAIATAAVVGGTYAVGKKLLGSGKKANSEE